MPPQRLVAQRILCLTIICLNSRSTEWKTVQDCCLGSADFCGAYGVSGRRPLQRSFLHAEENLALGSLGSHIRPRSSAGLYQGRWGKPYKKKGRPEMSTGVLFIDVVLAFFETVPLVCSCHSQRQFQYSSTSKSHLSESSRHCVERICLKYRTVKYNVWTMAFRKGTQCPRDPMMVFKRGWQRSESLQPRYLGPVRLNQYFNVGGASFWYAFGVRPFDTTNGTSSPRYSSNWEWLQNV